MTEKHTKKMYLSHRERLRKQAAENGVDRLENYRLIELFLFDCLPRVDTYPASHRLLDAFGTVNGVFSASKEELMKIHGIGPKTAERIVAAGELITRCVAEKMTAVPIDSDARAVPLIMWLMRNAAPDSALALVLDKDGRLKHRKGFPPGTCTDAYGAFIAEAAGLGGKRLIFAHKHPGKDLRPSADDMKVTWLLAEECRSGGVALTEHYVVNDTDAVGIIDHYNNRRGTHGKEKK